MKILVVGGGGREHALAARIRRDAPDAELFVAPGNPGTAAVAHNVPIPPDAIGELAAFAEAEGVDATVVGPEGPLAAGIADRFSDRGLPIFGPGREAALIEASKAFANRLMASAGVPTADFRVFEDPEAAGTFVAGSDGPLVVKASGLAAGKGVYVCDTPGEAREAVEALMVRGRHGEAGRTVVIEERLEGRELSVFFLTDGVRAVPLLPSRDHKRAYEGGTGPNTGGMGAFAPVEDAPPELVEEVRTTIALPVLEALADVGTAYRGFLYAGLMLTESGPRVIEFNCRLGDPEAQVVLPLLDSSLLEPMLEVARGGDLEGWEPAFRDGSALVTVLASGGYPGSYETGYPIRVPEEIDGPDLHLYHAGTDRRGETLVTAGGRVLGVTGLGATREEAGTRSREAADRIEFEGKHWRRDIGRPEAAG